jgi:pimeloyl-ACP methyl ester carboxylesterase
MTFGMGSRYCLGESEMESKPQTPDQISDAAQHVYDNLFTTAGGDDLNGDLGGPDHDIVATYRDWYRAASRRQIEITYDKPHTGKLLGYFLPHVAKTNKTAIVIHGITSSSQNTGPWARAFYDMGFNIFTPDLRGHGANEAYSSDRTMGIYDSHDMVLWAKKIIELTSSDAQIVMMGYSLGASVGLQAVSYTQDLPSNVVALVEDSGFPDLSEMIIAAIISSYPGLESSVLQVLAGVDKILFDRQQAHLFDGITIGAIERARVPLLVIYGTADTLVYPENSKLIYDIYPGKPKAIHEVPGAGHPQCIAYGYAEYRDQIGQFLSLCDVVPGEFRISPDCDGIPSYSQQAPSLLTLTLPSGWQFPAAVTALICEEQGVTGVFDSGTPLQIIQLRQTRSAGSTQTGTGIIPKVRLSGSGSFSILFTTSVAGPGGNGSSTQQSISAIRSFKAP